MAKNGYMEGWVRKPYDRFRQSNQDSSSYTIQAEKQEKAKAKIR